MTTYRIAELTGTQLDAAVLLARGAWSPDNRRKPGEPTDPVKWCAWACYSPSTWWGDGGPLIESEGIDIIRAWSYVSSEKFAAFIKGSPTESDDPEGEGPTRLIAAMRAYVASKLGETVELP